MSRANPFEDLSDFAPTPSARAARPVQQATIDKIAADADFPSRNAPQPLAPERKTPRRRHVTGRNQQINIKATAECIETLYRIADQHQKPLGEVLEMALAVLEGAAPKST